MNRFYLVVILLFGAVQLGWSQTHHYMSNTPVTTCNGHFESSGGFAQGGAGASGYAFNENFTKTFCPGTPGGLVSMSFVACVIGSGDVLTVYNGVNTTAPILGVYDATNFATGIISAQLSTNPGGCLTFTWVSDGVGTGNGWNALISCDIPCQAFEIQTDSLYPDTVMGGYINVCQEDTAMIRVAGNYLNNNQNYSQSDSTTSFYWYYDSVLIDSGSTLYFPADSSGAFLVQVYAVDSMGCQANFNLNYWIRVTTEPSFAGAYSEMDTICFGDTNTLHFDVSSVAWGETDTTVSVPTTFLPDGSGSTPGIYNNILTFSKFTTGQTVTSVTDIVKFWANIEHSYIGDLSISMTCPNGSTTVLKEFPGGNGTWLGEACADPGVIPGIGYTYEWKQTNNTYASMVPYVNAGCAACPFVNNFCGAGGGNTLPANSYVTAQPISNLIGCPLNGTWTLTIVDQWASDDGYLFSWGVEFDPALYPSDSTHFDPGVDSVWIDTTINSVTASTNFIDNTVQVVPQIDSATYCYTVTALDGFGCTHDSIICFFVRDRCDTLCYLPQSPIFTTNKVGCPGGSDGSILVTPDPSEIPLPWTFIWTDINGTTLQSVLNSSTSDSIGGLSKGVYNVQIIDGNGCSSNWPFFVGTITPMQVVVVGNQKTSCYGAHCDGDAQVILFNGTAPYSYLWSNGDTLTITNTLCVGNQSVVVTDNRGCKDTTFFSVTEPDPIVASADGDAIICIGGSTVITGSALGGIPPYSFDWGLGYSPVNSINVSPTGNTSYWVTVTDVNNCPSDSAMVTISVRPPLTLSFQKQDTVCPGDNFVLMCQGHGGDSNYVYNWNGGTLGSNSIQLVATISQFYTVTVTDGCGSTPVIDSIWVQVGGYPAIDVDVVEFDTICEGEHYVLDALGMGGIGNYTYVWNQGLGVGPKKIVTPSAPTTYSVTVTDECFTDPGYADIHIEFGDFEGYSLWVDTNMNCDPATFSFAWDTSNWTFEYFVDYGKGFKKVLGLDTFKIDLTKDGCQDVMAKLITKFGCVSTKSYPCMVEVLPIPIANFDFRRHHPNKIEHYVDFWDRSIDATSWIWYKNDVFFNDNEKFSVPFEDLGIYNVKLVVANDFGCKDSIDTDLEVRDVTTYYYPTAFTPNGDGNNDVFKIVGEGVRKEDYSLIVYDRWGGIVYNGTTRDEGWNGKELNRGKDLPAGSYSYFYSLRLHTGRKYSETGSVMLLK